jgi:hypothetical protein
LGASPALRAGNRAFLSNLFYRFAVKKDFHYNPLRSGSSNLGQEIAVQFPGRIIAALAIMRITRRSQF